MAEREENSQPPIDEELEEGELSSDEGEENQAAQPTNTIEGKTGDQGVESSNDLLGPTSRSPTSRSPPNEDKSERNIQQRLLEEAGQHIAPGQNDDFYGGVQAEVEGNYSNRGSGPAGSGEEGSDDDRKRRRRKKKEHKKRKRESKDKKKKHRGAKYVDHDRVADDYPMYEEGKLAWPGYGGKHNSPPGPYDSPHDSNSDSFDEWDDGARRGSRPKYDRPPLGPYDSPYESPPGAYDSPSDDEYGPPPKLKRMDGEGSGNRSSASRSMLSMVGDDYMDANVAANEREEIFDRNKRMGPTASKLRKLERSRQYREKQRERELTKGEKRALAEADDRPQCRFFMEGKCSKGYDCPYSHDFRPPKKLEVCKFYISDTCTKGRECLYLHGEFPCRFFHNHGGCDRGDNCKFSHAELTKQSAGWLEKSAGFIEREEKRLESEGMLPPSKGSSGSSRGRRDEERATPAKKSLNNQSGGVGGGGSNCNNNGDGQGFQQQNTSQPEMKKIPSIFEIKTYAPGTAPRNPAPIAMNRPQVPPGPRGPGPFFNDMNGPMRPPGPGIRGPLPGPMMGPQGPRPQGGPGLLGGPPGAPLMPPPGLGPVGPQGFYNNFYMDTSGSDNTGQQGDQMGAAGSDNSQDLSQDGMGSMGGGAPPSSGANVPFDISHLPPKQRELFLRIQQQQHSNTVNASGGEHKEDDDNWYSDDEEGDGQNKQQGQNQNQSQGLMAASVANLIQSIRHQQTGAGSLPPPQQAITSLATAMPPSQPPPINIATMLTAIRQSMGPTGVPNVNPSLTTPASVGSPQDPRSRPADPRKPRPTAPEADLEIKCFGVKVKYALRRITVEGRPSLPTQIIKHDPKFKDDPRIDKYYQPNITQMPRAMTDRHGAHKKKSDPRLQRKGSDESQKATTTTESQPPTAMGLPLPPLVMQRTMSVPSSPSPQNKDNVRMSPMAARGAGSSPPVPAELLSPPVESIAPKLPDALLDRNKPAEPIGRVRTNSEDSDNAISPTTPSGSKKLDYRNDPRFKKKKLSATNLTSGDMSNQDTGNTDSEKSPQQDTSVKEEDGSRLTEAEDTGNDDSSSLGFMGQKSRRDQVNFDSPLAEQDSQSPKEDMYGGYNRPPNENYKKFQEESRGKKPGWKGRGAGRLRPGRGGVLQDSHSPNMGSPSGGGSPGQMPPPMLAPILPEQMEGPPSLTGSTGAMPSLHQGEEPSLKDMFKTIDPTASPFC